LALAALVVQLAALMAGKAAPALLQAQLQLVPQVAAVVLGGLLRLPVVEVVEALLRAAMLLEALAAREAACKQKAVVVLVLLVDTKTILFTTALVDLVARRWAYLLLVGSLLVARRAVPVGADTILALQPLQVVCPEVQLRWE
jgi:hypothetical protein